MTQIDSSKYAWRCASCGEMIEVSDFRARWNGSEWEHKCGDPQAGYFPCRCFGERLPE